MTIDELWDIYVKAQQAQNEALEARDRAEQIYLEAKEARNHSLKAWKEAQ